MENKDVFISRLFLRLLKKKKRINALSVFKGLRKFTKKYESVFKEDK